MPKEAGWLTTGSAEGREPLKKKQSYTRDQEQAKRAWTCDSVGKASQYYKRIKEEQSRLPEWVLDGSSGLVTRHSPRHTLPWQAAVLACLASKGRGAGETFAWIHTRSGRENSYLRYASLRVQLYTLKEKTPKKRCPAMPLKRLGHGVLFKNRGRLPSTTINKRNGAEPAPHWSTRSL